jgi:hypothetical protein
MRVCTDKRAWIQIYDAAQQIPTAVNFAFLDRGRYFLEIAPQWSSRGGVDPVPGPLLLRKCGIVGNQTRDLRICSQEPWPLDHRYKYVSSPISTFLRWRLTDIWLLWKNIMNEISKASTIHIVIFVSWFSSYQSFDGSYCLRELKNSWHYNLSKSYWTTYSTILWHKSEDSNMAETRIWVCSWSICISTSCLV